MHYVGYCTRGYLYLKGKHRQIRISSHFSATVFVISADDTLWKQTTLPKLTFCFLHLPHSTGQHHQFDSEPTGRLEFHEDCRQRL
jgi:hypothetical protein